MSSKELDLTFKQSKFARESGLVSVCFLESDLPIS
jgi:hypothetical protein